MEKISGKNVLKFLIGTIVGLYLIVIPINIGGGVDTFASYWLKSFVAWGGKALEGVCTGIVCLSTVLAFINLIFKPKFIQNSPLMTELFACSPFYAVCRLGGSIISLMVFFNFGPECILSIDTGGTMLPLATQLAFLIPPFIIIQTFILEFGFMEFLGTLVGFVCKPLFKLSEMSAVSIISSIMGPANAGIIGANQLYHEGYFTYKEAAIIANCFAISSIGWCVVVADIFNLMSMFGWVMFTIVFATVVVAIVSVRIPPIRGYDNSYYEGRKTEFADVEGNRFHRALSLAAIRAGKADLKIFENKIPGALSYYCSLLPIIICWGTLSMMLFVYTPVLQWISFPLGWFMDIMQLPEAYAAAPALLSGFADNYLPVILGESLASQQTQFVICTMSIIQLIFMSEIGAMLLEAKLNKRAIDIVTIFLERTIIALPVCVLISHFLF